MRKLCVFISLVCLMFFIVSMPTQAQPVDAEEVSTISLPWVLTSGMVIQRDQSAPVWGRPIPNEQITVTFAGQKKQTTADAQGGWRVELDAMPASQWGRSMMISAGETTLVLTDVLVGEVWVCAGQSNMWFPLRSSVGGGDAAVRLAESWTLRILDPQPTVGLGRSVWPLDDTLALTPARYFAVNGWSRGNHAAAGEFSAVGRVLWLVSARTSRCACGVDRCGGGGDTDRVLGAARGDPCQSRNGGPRRKLFRDGSCTGLCARPPACSLEALE